jgi:hypothetical protein
MPIYDVAPKVGLYCGWRDGRSGRHICLLPDLSIAFDFF